MDVHRSTNGALSITPIAALELKSITKRFGSVTALDGASIAVRPGTVHALLGENGAGKSTLMRIAFGMIKADGGSVVVDENTVMGMVHQHFTLVPSMTVAENVALGGKGRYNSEVAAEVVRRIGTDTGLVLDPRDVVGKLPISAQQRVEIVKALARNAKILILDEPTAVLAPAEAGNLLNWLREFADRGGTVVLITHKLTEALSISNDVTVLRHGKTVLAMPADQCSVEMLAGAMLTGAGEMALPLAKPAALAPEPLRVSGDSDTSKPARRAVSEGRRQTLAAEPSPPPLPSLLDTDVVVDGGGVTVRGGEIVGIAGVEGSGQYELLRTLAEQLPDSMGFIPEDRHREALILDFDLAQNVALKGAGKRKGKLRRNYIERATAALMQEFDVRAPGPRVKARTLSGGNQQKLVVGRELMDNPQVVIAENPTRGLDIQASTAVHDRLRQARDNGAAVVVYSSDIDEVLSLASRVYVVFNKTVREVSLNREDIGRAMLGIS